MNKRYKRNNTMFKTTSLVENHRNYRVPFVYNLFNGLTDL